VCRGILRCVCGLRECFSILCSSGPTRLNTVGNSFAAASRHAEVLSVQMLWISLSRFLSLPTITQSYLTLFPEISASNLISGYLLYSLCIMLRKGTDDTVHAMKAYGGSIHIAPFILSLCTKCRWVASVTPRPLCFRGTSTWYQLKRTLSGPQNRFKRFGGKKISIICQEQNCYSPRRPARGLVTIPTELFWLHASCIPYFKLAMR
jgi:hypothetical protein